MRLPMFLFPLLAAGAVVGCGAHPAKAQCPPDLWEPTWSDEFNGASLDPAKWVHETGRWPYNSEWETYITGSTTVADGHLTITSARDTAFDPPYTSGRIKTEGRFQQQYGRFEMRAKLPAGQGIWPAFWLLPNNRWPPEIDIMEYLGHDRHTVYFTNHWGAWPNVPSQGSSFTGPDFSAGFHTYACEWYPDRIEFYVDGVRRATHRNAGIPHEPMFIILNTAVGGHWGGYPDATTVFPQRFVIDYVRAYRHVPIEQRLANAGFESFTGSNAPAGWSRFGHAYSEPGVPYSGSRSGKLFGNFTGSWNSSGVYQDSSAAPGQTWAAYASFLNRGSDRMQGANTASLVIEWRTAGDQLISSVSAPALFASSMLDSYQRIKVIGTAPAGTAKARCLIRFDQPANAAGAAFFDDVVFGPVSCPSCIADFNEDGGIDGGDVEAFYLAWESGDGVADVNGDGGVDGSDVETFYAAWERGGC
ncbi:MAG: family 16 glycosylhydrolase [Phycisphaerae bacterium]|nr:family 16 glycosylhydrolase [Phycisphaerae bacterium]